MTNQQKKAMKEEKYLKILRASEDSIDEIDCESTTRESLITRQEIMKKESIWDKVKNNINNMNFKTPISRMGGVKRDKQ